MKNVLCRLLAFNFRYLDWDTEEETFVIASTQKKLCPLGRSAGIAEPALMAVALFQVWPLQFVAMMEITAKVSFVDTFLAVFLYI